MIKFVNPFEKSKYMPELQEHICVKCKYNKESTWGEDQGCLLGERCKGDTVIRCGSFCNKKSVKNVHLFSRLF